MLGLGVGALVASSRWCWTVVGPSVSKQLSLLRGCCSRKLDCGLAPLQIACRGYVFDASLIAVHYHPGISLLVRVDVLGRQETAAAWTKEAFYRGASQQLLLLLLHLLLLSAAVAVGI